MKILVTGKYDPDYNRTKIILDGLKAIPGVELLQYPYKNRWLINFFKLKKMCHAADVIFIPAFCHQDVPLIKMLTSKPVVFDPLISRYLSKVFDYKTVNTKSLRAKKNFYKDEISMKRADIVLCDTQAHKNYYHETFGISNEKLKVVEVGVNTDEFFEENIPAKDANKKFTVGFYGSFVPLQGVRKIIEAANILKADNEIEFYIIGAGFEYDELHRYATQELNLNNITFSGWVAYNELKERMQAFDIALGIFGDSLKSDLVIPNKIFHYAALGLPIITKNSTGIREIFSNGENILLTQNDAGAIAEAIIKLKNNPALAQTLGANGKELVVKHYNHDAIAKKVFDIFAGLAKQ